MKEMEYEMNNMIEVTGVDLSLFIRTVYALSRPKGMGFLHFQEGDIDQATLDALLNNNYPHIALAMDYVHGRACKLDLQQLEAVLKKLGRLPGTRYPKSLKEGTKQ